MIDAIDQQILGLDFKTELDVFINMHVRPQVAVLLDNLIVDDDANCTMRIEIKYP